MRTISIYLVIFFVGLSLLASLSENNMWEGSTPSITPTPSPRPTARPESSQNSKPGASPTMSTTTASGAGETRANPVETANSNSLERVRPIFEHLVGFFGEYALWQTTIQFEAVANAPRLVQSTVGALLCLQSIMAAIGLYVVLAALKVLPKV